MAEVEGGNEVPQASGWTVETMQRALGRKRIDFQESDAFTSIRGVVIAVGKTAMISVRATLTQSEKIRTIAHELGHLALGHTHPEAQRDSETLASDFLRRKPGKWEDEHAADVWAAHLLVAPDVWQREYDKLSQGEEYVKRRDAIVNTAHALCIPEFVVITWLGSRDTAYEIPPRTWFDANSPWFAPIEPQTS